MGIANGIGIAQGWGGISAPPLPAPPVADFSASSTIIYAGDTVDFTDLSTNTPTSWAWTFTGGTPSSDTTQNPSVVYNTIGTYAVDLTATNAGGSGSVSKPNYITVNFPYLLDIYGNAAAAYSVRKLRSAYAGNCLRVRRSSDNTETDIGFSNNFLNTSALTTFVGAGNGFVTKWYDQTGNNRDAIQTSAFNQPRIVSAGVLFTQNSLASINCYDSNRCAFNITEGGFGGNTILTNKSYGYAFVAVRTAQTTATRRTLFSIATTNTNSSRFYIGAIASLNTMAMGGKRLDANTLESTSTTTHGSAFNLLTGVARYADAEAYLYKNGVLAGSKVPFQTAGATSNTGSYNYESYIGSGRGDVAGGIENGSVSEVVIYNTDKASDRAAIETNIKNYFSIV
jgi:PKD repeat protein